MKCWLFLFLLLLFFLLLLAPSKCEPQLVHEAPAVLVHLLLNRRRKQNICILCHFWNRNSKLQRILENIDDQYMKTKYWILKLQIHTESERVSFFNMWIYFKFCSAFARRLQPKLAQDDENAYCGWKPFDNNTIFLILIWFELFSNLLQ